MYKFSRISFRKFFRKAAFEKLLSKGCFRKAAFETIVYSSADPFSAQHTMGVASGGAGAAPPPPRDTLAPRQPSKFAKVLN